MDELKPSMPLADSVVVVPKQASSALENLVLVVSASRVTSIVVSRIVERSGLRCSCIVPAELDEALSNSRPAAIILDEEPQTVMRIADHRRAAAADSEPLVILLVTNVLALRAGLEAGHVDSVVAKPVTPESLQPLLYDVRTRIGS
jgi:CheY-like chemotaxis protein